MQQTQKTLTVLQRLLREASMKLVDGMFAQDVSSASYGFLQQCQQSLMEAQQVMIQLQNELAQPSVPAGSSGQSSGLNSPHEPAQMTMAAGSDKDIPKRGRGRAKGRYLRDDAYEPRFREHLVSIFREYYIPDGDAFRTTDGTSTISASMFLAHFYLHDITPEDLAPDQHPAYEEWLHVLHEAQLIYDQTLPKADKRNT